MEAKQILYLSVLQFQISHTVGDTSIKQNGALAE
jgi:uncharacterized membrane protein